MCYSLLVLYHVPYSLKLGPPTFMNFRQQDCGLRRQAPHKDPVCPHLLSLPNYMHVIILHPRNMLQLQRLSSDRRENCKSMPRISRFMISTSLHVRVPSRDLSKLYVQVSYSLRSDLSLQ
ncbi:hypothetical protein M0657_009630 [Pyricularia oryzae]|nr:hypothetical protein M0657_009630 [Pyricularia oryzae]KAI7922517.1 hypothetical protein M9X92_004810 [Pyricularia oryzae]